MEGSRRSSGGQARLPRRVFIGAGGALVLAAVAGGALARRFGSQSPAAQTGADTAAQNTAQEVPQASQSTAAKASSQGTPQAGAPTPRTAPGAAPAASPAATPQSLTLTPQQRLGQLFMVGLPSGAGPTTQAQVKDAITGYHAGSLILYGTGWSSAGAVQAAVQPLQALAAGSNGGVGLFVSGNQEGGDAGTFQAFYGPGFSTIPSAVAQAQEGDPSALMQQAQGWGQELVQAGVNLNLAPVLDTVPPSMLASNDPIGHWNREYGTDPQAVATYGLAFLQGMRGGGVAVCAKHFPGLGRVTGNTDYTAQGIVDNQFSGADDPFLLPYKAAIDKGVDFVMVSLAVYPQVDSQPAVFSQPIVTGILRQTLGYAGVIITDDIGAAAAVADIASGDRALGFLRAGGDMLLTVDATAIAPMTAAINQAMTADAGFAAAVNASIDRILQLKTRYRLVPGSIS